jgi:polyisoprenyl-teichoic acid--peptidoglycan teichoic acid transferase
MAPASSPGQTNVEPRAQQVRFRRALTLIWLTLFAPGSAQLVAGNKTIGRLALRIWVGLWVVAVMVAIIGWVWPHVVINLALKPTLLGVLRLFLIVGGLGWVALLVDAWRLGQPLTLQQGHRVTAVTINGVLCFLIAGSMLFGAHLVAVQRDFVLSMFGNQVASGAHDGRYNVLLLGGDAGAGRWGLRPDSLTVASIDAATGRTLLVSLPRNLSNFEFAQGSVMAQEFPHGFNCDGCYLNGVSTWAQDHPDLFRDTKTPGIDATVMAVEGITQLPINYWVMVNLEGFKDLVDAVGGVKLNIRSRIPVGGLGEDVTGYLEPGTRVLNGHDTLWFARAREGSDDYSRMARQKCVMAAMLRQLSPPTALRNFEQIAEASKGMVSTNLPASELDRLLALADLAKDQKISTVSLVPPIINTANPNMRAIQELLDGALAKVTNGGQEAGHKRIRKQKSGTTGGSYGSLRQGYLANTTDDLGAAC